MIATVYMLCALTSLVCAVLLIRGFRRSRSRLLLWAALCFAGLAAENSLVFADLILFPTVNLNLWRQLVGLASAGLLVTGLVWESA
jgi:hypothetical protein